MLISDCEVPTGAPSEVNTVYAGVASLYYDEDGTDASCPNGYLFGSVASPDAALIGKHIAFQHALIFRILAYHARSVCQLKNKLV